jgi:predicted Zn-dependent peptidase
MTDLPRRTAGPAAIVALALASALALRAAPTTSIKRVEFSDTRLKNGLRVIISEDHTAPVFAIALNYNVGSRDERKGRTGFAHLFEHMMFKGSENVGPGEHPYLMFMYGGSMNGTTNKERTLYYEVMPANQLDLALFLEADRMRSLVITKEALDNQIHAVQEERRLRVDNQAYGRTFEVVDDLAYENFAYEHSVIGSMADLSAATVEDVAQFFKTYYAPNNTVLSIVGDVDTKAALARVRKYFEAIPPQPPPPPVDVTEPAQKEERRSVIEDSLARLARIDIAYKAPPSSSPDDDPLEVLTTLLSSGRSSRFFEAIVREKRLATGAIAAFTEESRGPGLLRIIGTVTPGRSIAELEAAIDAEIDRIKTGPIEDWEMEKARNGARSQVIAGLGSSLQRAVRLGEYALFYDKPDMINTRAEDIARVTAADVQRVARTYLVKTGRTVVHTVPKAAPPKGAQ